MDNATPLVVPKRKRGPNKQEEKLEKVKKVKCAPKQQKPLENDSQVSNVESPALKLPSTLQNTMNTTISASVPINNGETFSSAGFFLMLHDAHMKNQQLQHRIDLGLEREKQSADKAREEADRAMLAESNLALYKIMVAAGLKP